MIKLKFYVLFMIIFLNQIVLGQSFTYSGPTSATIYYGNTTAQATYYFSYSDLQNLFYPSLHISVDGELILGPKYCTSITHLPQSYTILFNNPGNHIVKFMLTKLINNGTPCGERVSVKEYEFTVNVKFQISIENIFGGGIIIADGTTRNSPIYRTSSVGNNISLGAIEQDYGNYHWIWNSNGVNNSEWRRVISVSGISSSFSNNQYTSYSVQSNDVNTRVIAGLRKICNVTFQNNFVGVGNGGTIKVNGAQYNSPTSQFQVIEGNTITAEAQFQTINGIRYTFDHWDDGSTFYVKTFTINNHETHTAYFKGKPSTANRNLRFGTTVGAPIVLYWDEHPNPYVTRYQIWRKVKNGPSEQMISEVNRGTNTYTDYSYLYVGNGGEVQLQYDVRPYYSIEGTYSDPHWEFVGANQSHPEAKISAETNQSLEGIPVAYKISSYPNPFNPKTTIIYELPERS